MRGTMLDNFCVEPRKATFILWGVVRMGTASFGPFPMDNSSRFTAVEPTKTHQNGGIYENRSFQEAENNKHLF